MSEKIYSNLEVTNLEHSEVEISAEIEIKHLEPYKEKALKKLGKDAKIPGFRPGHIPEKILLERIGEQGVLEESAEMALSDIYPQILQEKNLQTIGRPQISILKLAEGNPFSFKIKTAIVPTVTLPKYKEIADKEMAVKEEVKISDKEVEDVINEIRKTRAKAPAETPKEEGEDEKSADKKEVEPELPEFNDEFVKSLGEFENVDDFKNKIKENMLKEKEVHEKEKKRIALSDEIIKQSTIDIPGILVESELEKMTAQFKDDVMKMGMEFDDYLKNSGKTLDVLHDEWKETAEKRAKMQLILNKIAVEEKLTPDATEVEAQVNHLTEHYKDADPQRIHIYVETLLTNEKVFNFLEGTKAEPEKKEVEKK